MGCLDMDRLALLPCPFCGGEVEIAEGDYTSFEGGYAVRCRNCAMTYGAWGRLGEAYVWTCSFRTEAEAVESWNGRAAVADADFSRAVHDGHLWRRVMGRRRCAACGLNIESVIALDGCNEHAVSFCPNCGAEVAS